ncbi:MAG: efflux RND transporter periplasmic adaptor subunit [Anaerolineae bacterium]|nr:efflux RND transporter periplasmic adaptor subunit [Anaerolineae bacterium]MDW7990921.1 efflux RND transporter periplasmic adaptor subunit [Anaerolineae bacterium]
MLKRRWIWIVVAVVVVVAGVGGFLLWRQTRAATATTAMRAVPVRKGTLQVTVSASGSLEPVRQVDLSFDVSGKVAEVQVDIGDTVKAGQMLARLDTTSLELSLRQAEAQLKSAQAQLAKARTPATEEEIKAAEAAYYSALAQYQELKNSPSPESLASLKAQLEKAKVALERAQAAYDRVSWRPDISARPESQALQDATLDYQVALANYEAAAKGPSKEELAAAWRNVESAKAKLESLRNGPTEEDLASAEATLEQAQIAVETARRNLEAAVLKAPFDGVIAAMNLVVGEPAVSPAITLMDLSRFRITVQVDEMDVSQLAVGMPAVVTVDAMPDVALTGKVERIGVAASSTSGAVYYPVVIALDPTDAPLRAGMSASVTIRVQELTDQLLIPTWAILTNPITNRPYVLRRTASGVEPVNVQLGVRHSGYAQVLSGLSEGDILVVPNQSGSSSTFEPGAMRFIFGGVGGPPPGERPFRPSQQGQQPQQP